MLAFPSFRRITVQRSMALTCAALLAATITSPNQVGAQTFECELSKSKIRVTGWRVSRTTDTAFQDVLNTNLSFTQGGTGPGCVVVQFAAKVNVREGLFMYIRAVLKSEPTGTETILPPGEVLLASDGAGQAGAFIFADRGIMPGMYTVRMQWQTWPHHGQDGRIYMHERTMMVQHQ